jgi:surface protein
LSWLAVLLLVLVNVHTAASASCRKSLSRCTQHSDCCNNRRCMRWKRCSLFLQRRNGAPTNAPTPQVIYKCFESREELDEGIRLFRDGNATEMTHVKKTYGFRMANWCVDKITSFTSLFDHSAGIPGGFNEDISKWNTSSITSMQGMFAGQQQFNQDISRWDVSKVTTMYGMFFDASQFNQDISSWDVSKVTEMEYMFSIALAFNQSLCPWKDHMSICTGTTKMFTDTSCINTKDPIEDRDLFNNLCHPCTK